MYMVYTYTAHLHLMMGSVPTHSIPKDLEHAAHAVAQCGLVARSTHVPVISGYRYYTYVVDTINSRLMYSAYS
jgi:hypothetical protein